MEEIVVDPDIAKIIGDCTLEQLFAEHAAVATDLADLHAMICNHRLNPYMDDLWEITEEVWLRLNETMHGVRDGREMRISDCAPVNLRFGVRQGLFYCRKEIWKARKETERILSGKSS